ncbi:oxoglutarate/iron-dependent dioxygenase [Artemisia annua]|uniref:Oxoglutarate/iron-dependent dioxygenase n=1 Tax=Artemisia annua TaxID=35608 RepID=A0A2U1MCE6_ARTAN|nr:oxoglutarate/iron-dependent dioxygenase [Artemisia annua]
MSFVPIIDYSLLTSGTPNERSKVIQQLGNACKDWGCYMLVNHGIPETLIKEIMDVSDEFFNLPKEEKLEFEAFGVFDPIRFSSGFNAVEQNKDTLWREVLRLIAHPDFHCPHKPSGFSEIASDYVKRTQVIVNELLKGVSESLGFEASYMNKELNLDSSFRLLAVNCYPFLPDFDLARGLMPHTDHGVFTLLYENDVPGLEVFHNGKWVVMSGVPNAFLVLSADHLEIFSNGVYKSKLHRAVVKDECKRITLVNTNGPSLDTVVGPSPRLVDEQDRPAGYLPMKYGEYLELQTKLTTAGKHAFDIVRIQN